MTREIRPLILLLLLTLTTPACHYARKPPRITPDYSSPKATLRTFIDANLANNPTLVASTLHATGQFQPMTRDMALWLTSQTALDLAVHRRFGKDAHEEILANFSELHAFASERVLHDMRRHLPNAKVTINGDRATITGDSQLAGVWLTTWPIPFRNIEGHWKIDLDAARNNPDTVPLNHADHYPPHKDQGSDISTYAWEFAKLAPALNRLANDIDRRRIRTPQQATNALDKISQ
jgi:hypothetical protein